MDILNVMIQEKGTSGKNNEYSLRSKATPVAMSTFNAYPGF